MLRSLDSFVYLASFAYCFLFFAVSSYLGHSKAVMLLKDSLPLLLLSLVDLEVLLFIIIFCVIGAILIWSQINCFRRSMLSYLLLYRGKDADDELLEASLL